MCVLHCWQVHLHRDEAMEFLIKDADITLLCPAGMTVGQLSQLLTQRHTCLRGRQVYYRLRRPSQVCSVPPAPTAWYCILDAHAGSNDDSDPSFLAWYLADVLSRSTSLLYCFQGQRAPYSCCEISKSNEGFCMSMGLRARQHMII